MTTILAVACLALAIGGCGTMSAGLRVEAPGPLTQSGESRGTALSEASLPADVVLASALDLEDYRADAVPVALAGEPTGADEFYVAQLSQMQRGARERIATESVPEIEEEYDPWEPFNEKMFEFNRQLDRYLLKPVAQGYNVVMPEPFQVIIANGFDNIRFVPRFVNSLLQAKWGGAGRELSRFVINSTLGIGGLFDAAKYWGIEKSREDFGQTLGVWGVGAGPYLVLPFLAPMTVRDGIGTAIDGAMDPLGYLLPFFWTRFGMKVGDTVNDRSLNLDLFQGFEESVIDMYSAVRHGYLRRREQLIRE